MSEVKKSNREHHFDFELAEIVGVEQAILLKNISYWVVENRRKNNLFYFEQDTWWTEESLSSLASKYRYMKRSNIHRWMQKLESSGWIRMLRKSGDVSRYSTGRVYEVWDYDGDWKSELSHFETVSKDPKMGQLASQNETEGGPKWDDSCTKMGRINNEDNSDQRNESNSKSSSAVAPGQPDQDFTDVEDVNEDEKKGASKAAPAPRGWSKNWAIAFDEVNRKRHQENSLEYQAFNWKVCEDQNFQHLKNLREKVIVPGLKAKRLTEQKSEPVEDDFLSSARAVFELSWDYFFRLQQKLGGGFEYKPASIYKNFNAIKSFKNGNASNTTGTQAAESSFGRGIDHNGKFNKRKGY